MAAMWDMSMYNAGFFVIKATKNGLKLWKMTCELTSVDKKINDQIAFNNAIKRQLQNGKLSRHKIDIVLRCANGSYLTIYLIDR